MHIANEKKLAKRATELGNSADPKAFPEFLERKNFETKVEQQRNIRA